MQDSEDAYVINSYADAPGDAMEYGGQLLTDELVWAVSDVGHRPAWRLRTPVNLWAATVWN